MPKVKTITLDGGETAVKFEKSYPYYFVSNMGDDKIYTSAKPGITAYAEGVYTVLPEIETRISPERLDGTIYLFGSGTVQVRAEEIAESVSFKAVLKGGDQNVITDYNDLTDKPSIEGVMLVGNKTLEQLGISSFDGKYTSLSGKPYISAASNPVGTNTWIRVCAITNARIEGSFILRVGRSNMQFNLQDAPSTTLVGVLSYSFVNNSPEASFKVLNNVGVTNTIPQIRFSITTWGTNKTIYIDVYVSDIYSMPLTFDAWFNPSSFSNSVLTTPFTSSATVPSDFTSFVFQNKIDSVIVDSALSKTSTNPVQNSVITAAINDLSERISQLEE